VLDIDGLVCQKSDGSDASWVIHYSGETDNGPFHNPSSVKIRNLTMVSPAALANHPGWPVVGFANQSQDMVNAGVPSAFNVRIDAAGVKVFGLTADQAGMPCTVLATKPPLDLTSPVRA